MPSHPVSLRPILILTLHLLLGLNGLLSFPHQNPVWIPRLPHVCYMPCSYHLSQLDHSIYIWQRVKFMKLLVIQFSPSSYYFVPLWSRYIPQCPVLKYSVLFSSHNIRDKVSYWSKTTGKVVVLYILNFMFLDMWETKHSERPSHYSK